MITYSDDDWEYAQSRLKDTIVILKSKQLPVYVMQVQPPPEPRGKAQVIFTFVGNTRPELTTLDDLDLSPVQLGYMNLRYMSCYTVRMPMRQDWRQGLRPTTTLRTWNGDIVDIDNKAIVNTIMGKYPSINECLKRLYPSADRMTDSVAFNRNFSIGFSEEVNKPLYYKGKWKVGELTKSSKLVLSQKFEWLQETIEEEVNG